MTLSEVHVAKTNVNCQEQSAITLVKICLLRSLNKNISRQNSAMMDKDFIVA